MEDKQLPSNIWTDPVSGNIVKFTWIAGNDLNQYIPFTQTYGVCYNKDGKILIQKRNKKNYTWCLPGGTVEKGENPEETLRREFLEEVDVKIKNIVLLGGQKIEVVKGSNTVVKGGEHGDFYQLRYYCEVDEILPQTPDPDNGEIRLRKFIDPLKVTKYFDWGDPGIAIFKQAADLYKKFHYHEDKDRRIDDERHVGIVLKGGKILMIHRIKNGYEYYVLPGGHRRVGETGLQTVEREVQEETNIITKCQKEVFGDGKSTHYLCNWVSGVKPELVGEEKVKHSPENFYEPLWIDIREIEKLNILPESAKEWLIENT